MFITRIFRAKRGRKINGCYITGGLECATIEDARGNECRIAYGTHVLQLAFSMES
jgi:hypothetical protein